MPDRRQFIQYASAAVIASTMPSFALARPQLLPTRMIPGTEESLPIVGLGNSSAFRSGDIETATRLLDVFLHHGGAYVDVSGSARMTVGRILASRNAQDRSFLGNYLQGQDLEGLQTEIKTLQRVQGEGALDLSMKRDVADLGARADQFQTLKEEGLVRYTGIGRPNKRFYPAMMTLMNDGVVDFVQVNYSMLEPEAADDILPLAMERGIAVVINRPFLNGDYFGVVSDHELPQWAAEFDCNSWAQFSLKYIISHPAVNCVLTETANPKHVLDNLGAGFGELPDQKTRVKMRRHLLTLV